MLSKTSTIQSFVTVQKLNSQCSQSHFFTYESINACENLETSCLYSDFVFSPISKLRQRNSNSYFNLLLLLSGDISSNPGPLCNNQLQTQNEWSTFNSRDLHFTISALRVCYLKQTNLEILPNYLIQQLKTLVNQNWTILFSHLKHILIIITHFAMIEKNVGEWQFAT